MQTIRFLIETTGNSKVNRSREEKRKPENFTITYLSLDYDPCRLVNQVAIHVLIASDREHMFDKMAEKIVDDWLAIECSKSDDHIFGLENLNWQVLLPSEESKKSLVCLVLVELKQHFNQDYISRYDRGDHSYLFELVADVCSTRCDIISSKVKEV